MQQAFLGETSDLLIICNVGVGERVSGAIPPGAKMHSQAQDGCVEDEIAVHDRARRSLRCSRSGRTLAAKNSSSGA